jgi:anti-sigma factor RsiW
MKHASQDELFAYREGDAKGREAMAAHLKECGECRAELARLEEVFAALDALPVPDAGEDYGARVWRQLAPRLPERRASWWQTFFTTQRLAVAGSITALVVAAFYFGRVTKPVPSAGTEAASAGSVRERVLVVAVGEHLGKSEMVLVELSNATPAENGKKLINISAEQRRAESLVEQNRLYRQTAMEGGDNAMASTLDELERVLMDVANSPAEVTPAQFESIQKRIAERGILLKVRVVRQELRTAETGRKSQPAQTDSTTRERNKV